MLLNNLSIQKIMNHKRNLKISQTAAKQTHYNFMDELSSKL